MALSWRSVMPWRYRSFAVDEMIDGAMICGEI
jgi:hypothetical protein